MDETMIEDMTSYDGETDDMVQSFVADYERRIEISQNLNPGGKANHYIALRDTVLRIFGPQLFLSGFYQFMAESFVIAFTTYMIVIIDYLKDDDVP